MTDTNNLIKIQNPPLKSAPASGKLKIKVILSIVRSSIYYLVED